MLYVADTHALVWYMEGKQHLSRAAHDVLASATSNLQISAVSLAEIAFLSIRNRIGIRLQDAVDHVARSENIAICTLHAGIVERLPAELDIHDGIIVTTALACGDWLGDEVAVVTKDRQIRDSGAAATELDLRSAEGAVGHRRASHRGAAKTHGRSPARQRV
jgi:PIN domain nuclease of toxin-antitoxin system